MCKIPEGPVPVDGKTNHAPSPTTRPNESEQTDEKQQSDDITVHDIVFFDTLSKTTVIP